jgi:hypothetical protein
VISTLSFSLPIYLSAPANIKADFVKDVFVRLGIVGNSIIENEEILAEFDSLGLDYENFFSAGDFKI